jgi:hypothetical protein
VGEEVRACPSRAFHVKHRAPIDARLAVSTTDFEHRTTLTAAAGTCVTTHRTIRARRSTGAAHRARSRLRARNPSRPPTRGEKHDVSPRPGRDLVPSMWTDASTRRAWEASRPARDGARVDRRASVTVGTPNAEARARPGRTGREGAGRDSAWPTSSQETLARPMARGPICWDTSPNPRSFTHRGNLTASVERRASSVERRASRRGEAGRARHGRQMFHVKQQQPSQGGPPRGWRFRLHRRTTVADDTYANDRPSQPHPTPGEKGDRPRKGPGSKSVSWTLGATGANSPRLPVRLSPQLRSPPAPLRSCECDAISPAVVRNDIVSRPSSCFT